jgi:hypothetical protein
MTTALRTSNSAAIRSSAICKSLNHIPTARQGVSLIVAERLLGPRITPGTVPGPPLPLPSLADTLNKRRLTEQILNIAAVVRK